MKMELERPVEYGWDAQGSCIWYEEPYPNDMAELLLKESTDDEEIIQYDDNDDDLEDYFEQ